MSTAARPRRDSTKPAIKPVGPAPTTSTSVSTTGMSSMRISPAVMSAISHLLLGTPMQPTLGDVSDSVKDTLAVFSDFGRTERCSAETMSARVPEMWRV